MNLMTDASNSSQEAIRAKLFRNAKPRYDMNEGFEAFDLGKKCKVGQKLFNKEDTLKHQEPESKKMLKTFDMEEEHLFKSNAKGKIKKKSELCKRKNGSPSGGTKPKSPKSSPRNRITNYYSSIKSPDQMNFNSDTHPSQVEGANKEDSMDSVEFVPKKSKSKKTRKGLIDNASWFTDSSGSQTYSPAAGMNIESSMDSLIEFDTGAVTEKSKSKSKKTKKGLDNHLDSDTSDSEGQTLSQIAKKEREKKASQEETKGAENKMKLSKTNSKEKVEPKVQTTWLSKKKTLPVKKTIPSNQMNQNICDADFLAQFKKAKTKPTSKRRRPPPKKETLNDDSDFKSPVKNIVSTAKSRNPALKKEPWNDDNDFKSPVKNKVAKAAKNVPVVDSHKQSLDIISKITKEIEKQKVERLKFQEMEKQMEEESCIITCSPNLIKARERITEMNSFILDSTILEKPPGLRVINCEEHHSYYRNIDDLDDSEAKELLAKCLSYKRKMPKNFDFLNTTSAKTLDKLFKIVSYLNDDDAIKVSQALEAVIIKYQDWLPKIRHIIVALINYGIFLDNCPFPELFLNHKLKLRVIDESDIDIFGETLSLEEKEKKIQCANNLFLMLEILIICFEKGRTYTALDLRQLVVIFLWIRMERNYLEHLVNTKILKFCSLALDGIKETMWPDNVDYISKKLIELDPECHHHNMAFLAEFLPDTQRGNHLRRVTSFKALHVIYGIEIPQIKEDITVEKVYHLVKKYGIRYNTEDFYETNSIITLISFCLNLNGNFKKEPPEEIKYLKKLANLLYSLSVPIIDSIKQQDTTRIKNSLLGLRCKVTLYYSGMDVKEASLERLMDNTKCISPTKGRRNRKAPEKRQLFKDSSNFDNPSQ